MTVLKFIAAAWFVASKIVKGEGQESGLSELLAVLPPVSTKIAIFLSIYTLF